MKKGMNSSYSSYRPGEIRPILHIVLHMVNTMTFFGWRNPGLNLLVCVSGAPKRDLYITGVCMTWQYVSYEVLLFNFAEFCILFFLSLPYFGNFPVQVYDFYPYCTVYRVLNVLYIGFSCCCCCWPCPQIRVNLFHLSSLCVLQCGNIKYHEANSSLQPKVKGKNSAWDYKFVLSFV